MNRRSVLATVAASLPAVAGCAGVVGDSSGNGLSGNGRGGNSRDGDPLRDATDFPLRSEVGDVAVTSVVQPSTLDAAVAVGVARGVSDAHPPQIGAVFENTGDERRTVRFGGESPLAEMANSGPADEVALHAPPFDGTYEHEGCWYAGGGAETLPLALAELDPGETVANRLDLLSTSSAANGPHCLPEGSFRFEQSVVVEGTGAGDSFGFAVEIG